MCVCVCVCVCVYVRARSCVYLISFVNVSILQDTYALIFTKQEAKHTIITGKEKQLRRFNEDVCRTVEQLNPVTCLEHH